MWGALLGLAIEAAQMLLASGVSQGLSVATRAAGVLWGLVVFHTFRRDWLDRHRRRWSGHTRNWQPISVVTLNPERDDALQIGTSHTQKIA